MGHQDKQIATRAQRRPITGIVAAVALVVVGVLVGMIILDFARSRPASTDEDDSATPARAPAAGHPRASGEAQTPPWEATPKNTPPVPEGHLPAWQVDPPPPEPAQAPPPRPAEPRDPATHVPPKHNPGGVNGDRPPRPVPGLETR